MNMRQQKARVIVAGGGILFEKGSYWVPSQSGPGRHRVTIDGLFPTCSCADHELSGECKHVIAVRAWAEWRRSGDWPDAWE